MPALVSRRHSSVAARVRRIAAVLAGASAGLLAWIAAVPAASAAPIPYLFGAGAGSPARPASHSVIRVAQGGGMPGWQIAAIAVAAAAAAVFLDRAWFHRSTARAA